MKAVMRTIGVAAGVLAALGALGLAYIRSTGLNARAVPGAAEARVARALRSYAVPARLRKAENPVPLSEAVLTEGMAHFADHCASCHASDGSGNTELGRGLFPKSPDMRLPATQELTDGELFYIIENGVRFTGMPGWSTGTSAGETASWHLVHVIRHLPRLTPTEREQIEARTPRSLDDVRQQIEEDAFLKGSSQ